MRSSSRASGTNRNCCNSECAASWCKSTPCTSNVHPGWRSGGNARARDRPCVSDQPRAAVFANESRLHVVARRQSEQVRSRCRRHEAGNRVANEQRLALPVAAHELARSQTAEQRAARDRATAVGLWCSMQILLESARGAGYKRVGRITLRAAGGYGRPRIGAQRAANGSRATTVSWARSRRSARPRSSPAGMLARPGRHAAHRRASALREPELPRVAELQELAGNAGSGHQRVARLLAGARRRAARPRRHRDSDAVDHGARRLVRRRRRKRGASRAR